MTQIPNNKERTTRELLRRASVKAIRSLLKLMQDEEVSESVRCTAARSILELHFKECELADIEESIAELRSLLQDAPSTQKRLRAMNLLSLKRELEHLKALAFSRRTSFCVCEYVEIIDGQALTTTQEQTLMRNRECYERNHDRNAHVGFSSITLPPHASPRL